MEWNECLNDWGTRLRGLAQGGLHYGGDGETGLVRYRRVREIALQMMDSTDCVDDGEVTEMACKLQKRVAASRRSRFMPGAPNLWKWLTPVLQRGWRAPLTWTAIR